MNTIAIDTHKTIEKLKNKGFSQEQAEGVVDALTGSELVTQSYLDLTLEKLEKRLYRAMLIQTGTIAAIVLGILTLLG